MPVPKDCAPVVEAFGAQRISEHRIVAAMLECAGRQDSVRAAFLRLGLVARAVCSKGVDLAEGGRCQRNEQLGMLDHGLVDALPAEHPGGDEDPGVRLVERRARRAQCFSTVLAGDPQEPGRELASLQVDHRSSQPDGM